MAYKKHGYCCPRCNKKFYHKYGKGGLFSHMRNTDNHIPVDKKNIELKNETK